MRLRLTELVRRLYYRHDRSQSPLEGDQPTTQGAVSCSAGDSVRVAGQGTATQESDIDILVIAPTTQRFFNRLATVRRLTRDLCYKLAFEPIVLTPEETAARLNHGDQFIRQITEEGIRL